MSRKVSGRSSRKTSSANTKSKGQKIAQSDGHPWVIEAARILRERGQTVGFAESCTGGLLSAIFTRLGGVSSVYLGSFVTYANQAKTRFLGVPETLIKTHGAVSVPVARRMAEGAREGLHSSWAIGVTGIAGPSGGTPDKPVGTVCFAIVGPGFEEVARRRFTGDRRQIQMKAARFALRLLLVGLRSDLVRQNPIKVQEKIRKKKGR